MMFIRYEILSLSPLQLEESAPGSGALCGAAFLNLRFTELIKSRLGIDAFEKLPTRTWTGALMYFEDYAKKMFNPMDSQDEYDDNTFEVPMTGISDTVAAGIEGSYLTITAAEMCGIFRPLLNSVINLIERQRNMLAASGKTAKGVILVGGFSESDYLYRCIKNRFADDDPPPAYTQTASTPIVENPNRFVVLHPKSPWTAVVRGAVLSALEQNIVASRKATRHYGILHAQEWDQSIHSAKNKYWSSFHNCYYADNQIDWHVKRGQVLKPNEPLLLPFIHDFKNTNGFPTTADSEIIVSDAVSAPREFEKTDETRVLCTLRASLQGVPRKHFKKRTKSGLQYRTLDHQIGMTLDSGSLTFDLESMVPSTIRSEPNTS